MNYRETTLLPRTESEVTIGIAIPAYDAGGYGQSLLYRCLQSLSDQTVRPDQVIISSETDFRETADHIAKAFRKVLNVMVVSNFYRRGIGGNSNSALAGLQTTHALVLHQDDAFSGVGSLKEIRDCLVTGDHPWISLGTVHVNPLTSAQSNTSPKWPWWSGASYLLTGRNSLGSPSTVVFTRSRPLRFSSSLSLTVDIDFYLQIYQECRKPPFFMPINMLVGSWIGQTQQSLGKQRLLQELPVLWGRFYTREFGRAIRRLKRSSSLG